MNKILEIGYYFILIVVLTACERNAFVSGKLTIHGGVCVSSDTVSIGEKIDVSIGTSVIVTDNSWTETTSSGDVIIHNGSTINIGMFSTAIVLYGGTYQDVDLVFNFITDDDTEHVIGTLRTTLADFKEGIKVPIVVDNISEGNHKISVTGKSETCPNFEVNVDALESKDIFVGSSATMSGVLYSDKLIVRNDDVMMLSIENSHLLCRITNPQAEITIEYLLDGKCITSSTAPITDDDLAFKAPALANKWSIGKHTISVAAKTNIPHYSVDVSRIKPIEIEVVE